MPTTRFFGSSDEATPENVKFFWVIVASRKLDNAESKYLNYLGLIFGDDSEKGREFLSRGVVWRW